MSRSADRPFGATAKLAIISGLAVIVPSLLALAINLVAVVVALS